MEFFYRSANVEFVLDDTLDDQRSFANRWCRLVIKRLASKRISLGQATHSRRSDRRTKRILDSALGYRDRLRPLRPMTFRTTNRWTRAAGARFSTRLIRRRVLGFAPP